MRTSTSVKILVILLLTLLTFNLVGNNIIRKTLSFEKVSNVTQKETFERKEIVEEIRNEQIIVEEHVKSLTPKWWIEKVNNLNRIPLDKSISMDSYLETFYKRLQNDELFDGEVPKEIDYNILRAEKKTIPHLSLKHLKQLFVYTSIAYQTFDNSKKILGDRVTHDYVWEVHRKMKQQEEMTEKDKNEEMKKKIKLPTYCNNRVDVIWTFVNGSEPHWMKTYQDSLNVKIDNERYREYGSLKYSMRSVYENVPYDIHWHLIVQDEYQIPTFLDKSKLIYYNDESKPGTLRIIYHRDYFPDVSVLPVFNSNAIEAAMYNIQGMGECVMYLNDDFFVNAPVTPSTNFNEDGTIRAYRKPLIASANFVKYHWDDIVTNTNVIMNSVLNENYRRIYNSHHWFIFTMASFSDMAKTFDENIKYTMKQKSRTQKDLVFPFIMTNYMIETNVAYPEMEDESGFFYRYVRPKEDVLKEIIDGLMKKQHQFVCLNDKLNGNENVVKQSISYFQREMEIIYPRRTPFELSN